MSGTYWKAVRPDGLDFRTGTVRWRCGSVRSARNADALCRDCADTDPTWGQPVDYDDEPSPWVDEDGYDRTPGRDLDRIGGWL